MAHFDAHTLDDKPVAGKGELTLYRITYGDDGKPAEEAVQTWNLDTNEQGRSQQQIAASKAGQYRLAYKVTDSKNHSIEGGYIFVVRGDGFDGREFRFNDLELVTDKREYAPGEPVKLMITTNRPDSFVLLFIRPSNGVYLPPKIIRLKGKSTVEEIGVVQKDMPNFFIEAMTVADGRYHEELREVVVPPEKRVINVEVQPSQTEYRPGADATVKVKLTDSTGEPFVGSTVMAVYDRSVEYISGGSNVPEIKQFFWKWRRQHHPQHSCTLDRFFGNLLKNGEQGMSDLGVFGGMDLPTSGSIWSIGGGGRGGGGLKRNTVRNRTMMSRDESSLSKAAPMMAPASELADGDLTVAFSKDAGAVALGAVDGVSEGNLPQPTVRSNFADTAFWSGGITTDKTGLAEVQFKMPENLTGWKIKSWALGL
ncbi:MAG: alpha-2-macroglobulin, partial [Planctomycetes bacterium]|nr:alpha-2-macroglobulin [Planctomycetota bacterium]